MITVTKPNYDSESLLEGAVSKIMLYILCHEAMILYVDGPDIELIANTFCNNPTSHPQDRKYTIPMAFKQYTAGELASPQIWYGDIAKTVLAAIVPLICKQP